ncbi:hypothetical protein AB0M46_04390 [Dactylosporangium sp. NPDC051485]|uniref:hypothetical protein n=1 Tax=Dactylosporangium sp. NPDC051485 TaxID=3154846 RepID=UPI003443CC7A
MVPIAATGDLHATLDQQLLNVPVGQVEAQIPAHGENDDLRREPEPGERRPLEAATDQGGSMTSLLKSASILLTLNATVPLFDRRRSTFNKYVPKVATSRPWSPTADAGLVVDNTPLAIRCHAT